MNETYSIKLGEIIEKMKLDVIYMEEADHEKKITHKEINRPGLFLAGFHQYFDPDRIQILGKTEYEYLESLSMQERNEAVYLLMSKKPCCVIFCHGRKVLPHTKEYAKNFSLSFAAFLRYSAFAAACSSTGSFSSALRRNVFSTIKMMPK